MCHRSVTGVMCDTTQHSLWHNSPEWQEAIILWEEQEYHHLLNELELCAVSCQFEIEKLGLPKIGMSTCPPSFKLWGTWLPLDHKSQQQISRLVSKCGKTLHSTLEKYNAMAKSMIPPKPLLTWDEVTDLEFLLHIETLQSWDDIQMKEWTKQPFHDATRAWTKLQCAWEELDIIAVEACWLAASIGNKEAKLAETISQTKLSNPELAQYIVIAFHHWTNAHAHLHTKLARLKMHLPSNGLFQGQSTSSPSSPISN